MSSNNPEASGFFALLGIALSLAIIFHIIWGFENETHEPETTIDPCSRVPAILLPYEAIKKCIRDDKVDVVKKLLN